MKKISTILLAILMSISLVQAQTETIPLALANTYGGGTFLGPLSSSTRRYQLVINEDQLTSFVGKNLNGLRFRLSPNASVNWPTSDLTYNSYEIYLSASVAPANRSLTFDNNIVGTQTQVRTGPLTITAASYSTGGNPNAFGTLIEFTSPYLYSGGNLLVDIKHTGSAGTSTSVEAVLASSSPFYATAVSAVWSSSHTATTGSQGNASVIQLSAAAAGPLPVKFLSLAALAKEKDVILSWRAAGLEEAKQFVVEKSNDGITFQAIGNVGLPAIKPTEMAFSYTDVYAASAGSPFLYYRLKQEDLGGKIVYSKTLFVKLSGTSSELSLYPNPVGSITSLTLHSSASSKSKYFVLNQLGQVVMSGQVQLQSGINNFSLDFSTLPRGIYKLNVQSAGGQKIVGFKKD